MFKTFVFSLLAVFMLNAGYSQDLSLMTYNIRFDSPNDGENRWDKRKYNLAEQIKFYEPDVFGTQEGLRHQLMFLDSALEAYAFVGVGRDDGKEKGEYTAIFYRKDKLNLLKQSSFWLSETPEKVSVGWDAALPRICTYALFEDRESGLKFWVFNTHFDHIGQEARNKSARLILEKIKEFNSENLPVVLMGDLNLEPETEAIQYLSKNLNDSRTVSKKVVLGPEGTFNAFQFTKPLGGRIDYIFTDKSKIEVIKYAVLTDSKDLKYYSDHLPVYVEVKVKKAD